MSSSFIVANTQKQAINKTIYSLRTKINKLSENDIGSNVKLCGWIRSIRVQKECTFIVLNDGSNINGIQIVIDTPEAKEFEALKQKISELSTGCSIQVDGQVVKSQGKGQTIEVLANNLDVFGFCDPEEYPLQKKRHSFEFLRTISHLRPRTNTYSSVMRVRSELAFATHKFFKEQGFYYIHTPIITDSDCEGAGQLFQVSTLQYQHIINSMMQNKDLPTSQKQNIYEQDFFGKPTYLTCSGQLNAEAYACSLSDVYTFGPTFRAENSNTTRHLAEFWMIEPEMAFANLIDDQNIAEGYLKSCITHVLKNCSNDMDFLNEYIEKGLITRLQNVINNDFQRITYTDAIDILLKSKQQFEYPVNWGCDLQTEHERFLCEKNFKKPVIVTNYPKDIKAFYMHLNEDNKTVAAMDILVEKVGEIVGGSQREARLDVLDQRMREMNINPECYWWYRELRKYGTVPHAGFGCGFERLVQMVTGMENIRDVILFPRFPKSCEF